MRDLVFRLSARPMPIAPACRRDDGSNNDGDSCNRHESDGLAVVHGHQDERDCGEDLTDDAARMGMTRSEVGS